MSYPNGTAPLFNNSIPCAIHFCQISNDAVTAHTSLETCNLGFYEILPRYIGISLVSNPISNSVTTNNTNYHYRNRDNY